MTSAGKTIMQEVTVHIKGNNFKIFEKFSLPVIPDNIVL